MSVHDRLFPLGVNPTLFTAAYREHTAASSIQQSMAADSVDKKFSHEQFKQREAILDIAANLILNKRDSALDEFCRSWCIHRGIKLNP